MQSENIPANTVHCPIVGSMLVHRQRRWPNIEPTMGQCTVFAGIAPWCDVLTLHVTCLESNFPTQYCCARTHIRIRLRRPLLRLSVNSTPVDSADGIRMLLLMPVTELMIQNPLPPGLSSSLSQLVR